MAKIIPLFEDFKEEESHDLLKLLKFKLHFDGISLEKGDVELLQIVLEIMGRSG